MVWSSINTGGVILTQHNSFLLCISFIAAWYLLPCLYSSSKWKLLIMNLGSIPGVSKKAERQIFSTLRAKLKWHMFLHLQNEAFTVEDNIPLNLVEQFWFYAQFLETQSFSNFAWFLPPMREELCREWPFIMMCWGIPLIRVNQRKYGSMGFPKSPYERPFPTQFPTHSLLRKMLYLIT